MKYKLLYRKVCPQCGKRFNTYNRDKIYCCGAHKENAYYHRMMMKRKSLKGERYRDRIDYISAKTKATRARPDRCSKCSGPADMAPLRVCSKCRGKMV